MSLCLRQQGIIGVFWCYPAVVSFYFMFQEKGAWLANAALLFVVLPQVQTLLEPELLIRVVATLGMISVFAAIFVRVITAQQKRLKAQAVTDPLTGLFNRALLHDMLERAAEQGSRTGTPMSLLTLDIDHFKQINDSYGHCAGDTVLVGVAKLLSARVHRSDSVFRLGGEEFLILLHNTDVSCAQQVADELCRTVACSDLLPERNVTLSIGVAALLP